LGEEQTIDMYLSQLHQKKDLWTWSNLGNFNFAKETLNLWIALDDFGNNKIA